MVLNIFVFVFLKDVEVADDFNEMTESKKEEILNKDQKMILKI